MYRKMLVVLCLVLVLVAVPLLGSCVAEKAPPAPPSKEVVEDVGTVKVGISAGVTGAYGAVGTYVVMGWQDYVQKLNERGGMAFTDPKTGKKSRAKLELLWADDAYDVSKVLSNYRRFVEQGMVCFDTPNSGGTLALLSTLEKEKVPELAWPMALELVEPPGWYFLLGPTYQDGYAGFLKWAVDKWKESRPMKIAFIGPDTPVGRAPVDKGCTAYTKSLGVEMVANEIVPLQPLDTKPNLLKIMEKHPDYLYISSQAGSPSGKVIKDAYELGMKKETKLVSALGQYSEQSIKLAGIEACEGHLVSHMIALLDFSAPGVVEALKVFDELHADKQRDQYYLYGWSNGLATEQAVTKTLNKVGYPFIGQDIYNVLTTDFSNVDMKGLCPNVTFGPDKRVGASEAFWCETRNGKQVLLGTIKLPHIKRVMD